MTTPQGWTVTMSGQDYATLHEHLFQHDSHEHAAFLLVGYSAENRLLVRTVLDVSDNEFEPRGGHYEIAPKAVARAANRAARERLGLVWAHSHPRSGRRVGFSPQDRATIDRAHPALLEITAAPVGALVFGETSVAGLAWLPDGTIATIAHLRVLGAQIVDLDDGYQHDGLAATDARHARQILLFGNAGQHRLRTLRVAVVGAGGGGSLIVQMLAHLGVGEICVTDFDRVSASNLSRIVGANSTDALLRRRKVHVAKRHVRRIDRGIKVSAVVADAADAATARRLASFDAIFVATDTALGRHATNAIAYQHMIPTFVVGAKVQAGSDGALATIHTAVRIAMPGLACLHCQGAIPAARLHAEQLSEVERQAQDYLGGAEDIVDPSVISLNGIAASTAVTDFLLMVCGVLPTDTELSPSVWYPLERRSARRPTPRRAGCGWCDPADSNSALARGDTWPLPLPHRPHVGHTVGVLASRGAKLTRGWRGR